MKRWLAAFIFCFTLAQTCWPEGIASGVVIGGVEGISVIGQQSSGGGCAAATAYLARTSGESTATKGFLTTLICGLISDGNGCSQWSGSSGNMDILYVFAQDNGSDALLNLCSASFTASAVSTLPTFVSNQGYSTSGSSALTTGYNASTNGINYTLNSASWGFYDRTSGTSNGTQFGAITGGATFTSVNLDFSGSAFPRTNSTNSTTSFTNSNTQGQWIFSRTSSSATAFYKNGSSAPFGTSSDASSSIPNAVIYVLCNNSAAVNQCVTDQLSLFFMGGALSSGAQQASVASRFNTFMTAVGANVY